MGEDRDQLINLLVAHEGLRLKPYADTDGNITIGVGRNLTANGVTAREAMDLLNHDVDAAVADCSSFPWFCQLTAARQMALVDMRFNLGPARFRTFTQMLASTAAGDYEKASTQMLKSKWARQVGARATTLARMMATGLALLVLCCGTTFAQDAVDVGQARVFASPADIASWPTTVRITGLHERPGDSGGLALDFDRALPQTWKYLPVENRPWRPGDSTGPELGNYQYTVWVGFPIDGAWAFAGFIQMWEGRPSTGAGVLTTFPTSWAYDGRWGTLLGHVPAVGDPMAVLVSAGNARGTNGVTSVRERSNVVLVRLAAGDVGDFTFAESSPTPPPVVILPPPIAAPPVVTPPPAVPSSDTTSVDTGALLSILGELEAKINALFAQQEADTARLLAATSLGTPPVGPVQPPPPIVTGPSWVANYLLPLLAAAAAAYAGVKK